MEHADKEIERTIAKKGLLETQNSCKVYPELNYKISIYELRRDAISYITRKESKY